MGRPAGASVRGRWQGWVGASVCVLLAVCWLAAPGAAAAKDDPNRSEPLPFRLEIEGTNGFATGYVPIPEGNRPTQVSGTVASSYTHPGAIVITVNGERAAAVDARKGGRVEIPLSGDDVVTGSVALGMAVQLEGRRDCFADESATATLQDARIRSTRPSQPPATIAAFLSPGVPLYQVVTDGDPSPAEQTAALNAVAALTLRFGPATRVILVSSDEGPPITDDPRVVRVIEAAPPDGATNQLKLSSSSLELTGQGDRLAQAATALASEDTDVLDSVVATNLASRPIRRTVTDTIAWRDLDLGGVDLSGVGRMEQDIGVSQSMFGTAVTSLAVAVNGGVSALVPGSEGRIDLLWNDEIVDSLAIGSGGAFRRLVQVSGEQLHRDNTLTVRMSYVPAQGDCTRGLGAQLTVDPAASTFTAVAGQSLTPGFDRLPQVIGPVLPVGFGSGDRAILTEAAGALVASLQSRTPQQITTAVMDEPAFVSDDRPGLMVGATPATAEALRAPLYGGQGIEIGTPDPSFSVTTGEPFAFLQAFADEGRDLVLLGTSADSAAAAAGQLARYADGAPDRWAKLTGQVIAMHDGAEPVALPVRQPPEGPWLMAPIVATVITVVLLLALLLWWLMRRPKGPAPPPPGQAGS